MADRFSRSFSVADRVVGEDSPVFIVAEAGVAHFGSLARAFELVDLACTAGADAVKFQVYKTDRLIAPESEDWRARMRPKELPYEAFLEIQAYCRKRGIIFFATAHEEESLEFLQRMEVPVYKIGSGEVGNWPFLERVAAAKKPVILSTGMYESRQIGEALGALAGAGNPDVAVLHCVTLYPTSPEEVNLKAMDGIREAYDVMVGYSDHTRGIHFPLAAVARGARIVEKHITLEFDIPNAQDWKVSCGAEDFRLLVRQIREIEAGMGSGAKAPGGRERQSLNWARKSLVASSEILAGERITADKLCAKRPGTGIAPSAMSEVIGKRAKVKISQDTLIRWEHLS